MSIISIPEGPFNIAPGHTITFPDEGLPSCTCGVTGDDTGDPVIATHALIVGTLHALNTYEGADVWDFITFNVGINWQQTDAWNLEDGHDWDRFVMHNGTRFLRNQETGMWEIVE